MVAESEGKALDQEPLRWLMRGCPGAGKSHGIQILKERFFKDVLHWDLGIQLTILMNPCHEQSLSGPERS